MSSGTVSTRLLVKTRRSSAARQPPAASGPAVSFTPLFRSIGATGGRDADARARWYVCADAGEMGLPSPWDACHDLVDRGVGPAGVPAPEFAEPDIDQLWVTGPEGQQAPTVAWRGGEPAGPDTRLPCGAGPRWFADRFHSQLSDARAAVGMRSTDRVRIAHLDTGFDPSHCSTPQFLRRDLQRNFVDGECPDDARDQASGLLANFGHGTGTLGILAGASVGGEILGGAAWLDVVPMRVANSVVLFRTSAIARALDHVHSLAADPRTAVHVVTMSMGGLASQAWCDAVNALYDLGIVIVCAAGNNFGNLPTHHIVYPARFRRVIAACGVMADGEPYADLPMSIMAGNYGPSGKMATAIAAYTPNVPWARLGSPGALDGDGCGTSAATPQVAAAAALWIQAHRERWLQYSQGWMRVEAVRRALFESSGQSRPGWDKGTTTVPGAKGLSQRLGRGTLRAAAALGVRPAAEVDLRAEPQDSARFALLGMLTGLGIDGAGPTERMLELEALQLSQRSHEIECLLPDPDVDPDAIDRRTRARLREALREAPGASRALRRALRTES